MSPVLRFSRIPSLVFVFSLLATVARAAEPSLAVTYGPTRSVHFALNLKNLGVYFQPIFDYVSDESRRQIEYGSRSGFQAGYTAFSYRQMECRLIGGLGVHWVRRQDEFLDQGRVALAYVDRQWASELWMQPELRFYERFALVLQAQVIRYLYEDRDSGPDLQTVRFETPDLSLSELRIGLRYYLPLRH